MTLQRHQSEIQVSVKNIFKPIWKYVCRCFTSNVLIGTFAIWIFFTIVFVHKSIAVNCSMQIERKLGVELSYESIIDMDSRILVNRQIYESERWTNKFFLESFSRSITSWALVWMKSMLFLTTFVTDADWSANDMSIVSFICLYLLSIPESTAYLILPRSTSPAFFGINIDRTITLEIFCDNVSQTSWLFAYPTYRRNDENYYDLLNMVDFYIIQTFKREANMKQARNSISLPIDMKLLFEALSVQ